MAAKTKQNPERKTRTSKVPENETKEAKFVRLTNHRVNKVRKALDQIGLLGGPGYVSTEEQRKRIAEAITESVEFNLARLEKSKPSKSTFTL